MRLTIRSLVLVDPLPRVVGRPRWCGVRAGRSTGRRLAAQRREIEVPARTPSEERHHHASKPPATARRSSSTRSLQTARSDTGNSADYDGKDSPVTGNNPDADTVARTLINATTVQTVSKKAGKVTTTQTSACRVDGKTRTVTTKGVNASGQQVSNVAVYKGSRVVPAACAPPGTPPAYLRLSRPVIRPVHLHRALSPEAHFSGRQAPGPRLH